MILFSKPARTIIALAFTALLLAGCGQELSWRQKLTVEVETPEGVKTASSVVRAEVYKNPSWAFGGGGNIGGTTVSHVSGEAPFIELSEGRYLFTLLSSEGARAQVVIFGDEPAMKGWKGYAEIEAMGPTAPFVVPSKNWPRFVTFKDINDPSSVQAIDKDNLAATFGEGYRIKSVRLQITDERMTCGGIKRILPWLEDYYDKMLDGRTVHTIKAENRFANSLGSGSFATVRRCWFFSGWLD